MFLGLTKHFFEVVVSCHKKKEEPRLLHILPIQRNVLSDLRTFVLINERSSGDAK